MWRRRHDSAEFIAFFSRLDAALTTPCTIVVIGGAAVALRYNATHATSDLDLWSVSDAAIWNAVATANASAAEPIPVEKVGIAEPPYSFEDRLTPLDLPALQRLTVLPEAHDLALMKIARAEAHDLDAIADIHAASPLDVDTLIARWAETRTQIIGSKEQHRLNFLAAIALLFGAETARDADRRTAKL